MRHESSTNPVLIDRSLRTRGMIVLGALAAFGLVCGVYRFLFGLQASTNMNQQYPWGIWIVADVSLIALAAGGFVTAGVVHVLNRRRYAFLVRPALVTAMLGYTCACILLAADLGRYYNIWHPILPSMWQGNSALFEVGMCVMCYLIVLYTEFAPVFCERFASNPQQSKLARVSAFMHRALERIMPGVIIVGITISCLHQSSLGHVMVLLPSKLHPLWWSPILSLLFLVSAVTVGLPTAMFVTIWASRCTGRPVAIGPLARLARPLPLLLALYLALRLGDMVIRETYHLFLPVTLESLMFLIEILGGFVVPLLMLLSSRVRRNSTLLAVACLLIMGGVILNRTNVYWIGFHPVHAAVRYVPSFVEWSFTIGVVAGLVLIGRAIIGHFDVLTPNRIAGAR